MSKKKTAVTKTSEIYAVVSDIHFDIHHKPTWKAFKLWLQAVKPTGIIINGDFLDFGMLSRYPQPGGAPFNAIDQITCFVKEANEIRQHTDRLVIIEGNHDERWAKVLLADKGQALHGAKGLSLEDQCYLQGLHTDVEWITEDVINKGVRLGPFRLRHGHRQSGRWGGGKHVAATRLDRSNGASEIVGHFHKVQMFCKTAFGETAIGIVNGHMSDEPDYDTDPNWQRGFTIVELYGPANKFATPHPIIIQDGHFAWNGVVYDGNC